LECAFHLVRLEPSPVYVERLLRQVLEMLGGLEREDRWDEVHESLTRLARLANELRAPRPDVADVTAAALAAYFDSARVGRLLAMYETGGAQQAAAHAIVAAVGSGLAAPLFERLNEAGRHSRERWLTQLMCEHAVVLAPGLEVYIGRGSAATTAVLVRVLGVAGAGYEETIAAQLTHPDEMVVREALRALTRIGTETAASAVGALVRQGAAETQGHAEEALWRLPPERAHTQVLELLQRHDFVLANPKTAARLLDRIGRAGHHGLEPVMTGLVSLRFRFWNPALRRVGARAHDLLHQP
jgi:ATP:corrinoid adenosyltransferase